MCELYAITTSNYVGPNCAITRNLLFVTRHQTHWWFFDSENRLPSNLLFLCALQGKRVVDSHHNEWKDKIKIARYLLRKSCNIGRYCPYSCSNAFDIFRNFLPQSIDISVLQLLLELEIEYLIQLRTLSSLYVLMSVLNIEGNEMKTANEPNHLTSDYQPTNQLTVHVNQKRKQVTFVRWPPSVSSVVSPLHDLNHCCSRSFVPSRIINLFNFVIPPISNYRFVQYICYFRFIPFLYIYYNHE